MKKVSENHNLRIPGPARLASEVRGVLSQPMIGHRSHANNQLKYEVIDRLRHMC